MFCGMTVGFPGRCRPMWRPTVRPQRSYPPPGPKPMIICTDLPASASPCAAAGIAGANIVAAIAIAVSVDRLGRIRSLAPRAGSEVERRADRDHPRIRPEAAVGVENPSAGTNDILQFRLQHPPRRELRLIHHLDRGFSAADGIEGIVAEE